MLKEIQLFLGFVLRLGDPLHLVFLVVPVPDLRGLPEMLVSNCNRDLTPVADS